MTHARCLLCGARISIEDLRYEGSEPQINGAIVTRRYECGTCAARLEVSGFVPGAASTPVQPSQ